ncbi:MAG: hypothetical protein KAV82_16055, partial [Phycisphaerae bacterium]|nr:hypothetical protein [Phycisphaerae bacterium]
MAFAACLAWGNSVEAGTAVNWAGGTGMWSDPSAWDLTLVPNNNGDTYDVAIGSPVDDVSLDLSVTVDTVANAGTLRFLDGFSLTLAQPGGLTNTGQVLIDHSGTSGLFGAFNNEGFAWIKSGTLELNSDVNNTGTMWLGDGSYAGGTCEIQALDDLSFTGSGELYFYSSSMTQADQPLLNIPLGVTVTNGPDHRIHGGSGRIEGAGSFINQGMIDADAPLRTLTLDMDQFVNEGELFARSGNLDVNVDNWHNSGAILIANGSNSTFTGSQFTNDSGGVIESVGGAELSLSQNVTNFGLMSADSSGQITFSGSSALVINASGGVIDATAGTVRFEATSGYIQNFGVMQADEGVFEFANGVDVFGGSLGLSNHGLATVMTGTTTLTQVHTTLDSTSSLGVEDKGTGTATLTFDGILENSGGTLKAVSEAVGTTTFNLYGNIFDDGGTILSDGGDFNVSNATWVEAGVLSFDIRNAGEISFTNTDSTASQIDVSWAGTGGELVFNNYRKQGTPTHLDLSGWSADGGDFTVSGGSVLTGSGQAMLPADTTLTVTGAGSSLSLSGLTQSAAGSLIDLVSGGALVASNLAVDGDFSFRGGTFDGSLVLNPSAGFTVTSSTNWVTGDFSWVGDRDVEITGSSAALGVDGSMPVASGSSVRLIHNATRLNGAGVATNSGVIEGGAPSNSNWTYMDLDLVNNADGVVRAFQNGTATNTRFQLSSDITNAGLMEAKGANLYFSGANVQNSGTFQAVDHADGSKLVFLNNTTVTDLGGTTLIDGANSRLEVSGGADVALGTLSFTNGATGFVSGTNSALSASNLVDIAAGIQFQVASGARLNLPAGLNLDGELLVQSGGTVDAPITVNPTGQITVNSGTTTLDGGSVDLLNNGRLAIVGNSTRVNGTALIDNSGMIEGGATSSSNWTYLDNDVVNNADGVIRAFQNGTPTSTYFGLTGDITNAGLMKADGARLYLNGANITNSGMFEAVDNVAASRLQFLGSTVVTDDGGTT